MSVSMTLADLERQGVRGQNFLTDLHNYARTVWPRISKYDMLTQVGEKHISTGSAMLPSKGAGSQRPQTFLGPPTYAQTVWPRETQFGMVIHIG